MLLRAKRATADLYTFIFDHIILTLDDTVCANEAQLGKNSVLTVALCNLYL